MSDHHDDKPPILPAGEKDLDQAIDKLEGLLSEHDREHPAFMPAPGVAEDDLELPILTDVVDPLSPPASQERSDASAVTEAKSASKTTTDHREPAAKLSLVQSLEPLIDAEIARHHQHLKKCLLDLLSAHLDGQQTHAKKTPSQSDHTADSLPLFGELHRKPED